MVVLFALINGMIMIIHAEIRKKNNRIDCINKLLYELGRLEPCFYYSKQLVCFNCVQVHNFPMIMEFPAYLMLIFSHFDYDKLLRLLFDFI